MSVPQEEYISSAVPSSAKQGITEAAIANQKNILTITRTTITSAPRFIAYRYSTFYISHYYTKKAVKIQTGRTIDYVIGLEYFGQGERKIAGLVFSILVINEYSLKPHFPDEIRCANVFGMILISFVVL